MRFVPSPLCCTSTVQAAAQTRLCEVLLNGAALRQCPAVNQSLLAFCRAMPALPMESSGDGIVLANASIGKNVFAMNILFQDALCPAGSLGCGCGDLLHGDTPVTLSFLSFPRPFPSEETTENDDDVYRSLEELAE